MFTAVKCKDFVADNDSIYKFYFLFTIMCQFCDLRYIWYYGNYAKQTLHVLLKNVFGLQKMKISTGFWRVECLLCAKTTEVM